MVVDWRFVRRYSHSLSDSLHDGMWNGLWNQVCNLGKKQVMAVSVLNLFTKIKSKTKSKLIKAFYCERHLPHYHVRQPSPDSQGKLNVWVVKPLIMPELPTLPMLQTQFRNHRFVEPSLPACAVVVSQAMRPVNYELCRLCMFYSSLYSQFLYIKGTQVMFD